MNLLYRLCLSTPQIIASLRLVEVPVLKVASLVQDEDDVYRRRGPRTC